MRAIETTAVVGPDGKMVVHLPPGVSPGERRVVIVIDEAAPSEALRTALPFTAYPVGLTSDTLTFRREDLYGDPVR